MSLDNRTLLFSLMIVYGMMAMSMAFVSSQKSRDGLRKWAGALTLEAIAWFLIGVRGTIPDELSVIAANVMLSSALAAKLAALYEYRSLTWPRFQCLPPPTALAIIFTFLHHDDLRGRILYGSLIYGAQAALMAYAIWKIEDRCNGRAWKLLFVSTASFIPMFILRMIAALSGKLAFAVPGNAIIPNPIQLAIFVCIVALGIVGSMGFVLMIKERADREIRKLAMIDSLTQLLNRRAFMERAEKERSFAKRNALPLGLMMIDVDHFKSVNDRYGHVTGDMVLVNVANILSSRLRKQDSIGRYGGEEFCILLPSTDEKDTASVGEALRSAIENTPLTLQNHAISITVSIGVTAYPMTNCASESSLDRLFENADAALYQAKREGRNRVIMLPEA